MTLQVVRADLDRERWLAAWRETPAREVFGHPDYCALFAVPGVKPLCAIGQDGGNRAMFPFLLRDLSVEPWTGPVEDRQDVAVPIGYGGAYLRGSAEPSTGDEFWSEFEEWAEKNQVVCADARLSLYRDEILPMAGWRETASCDSVVIDLGVFREQGIASFTKYLRKSVRRAARAGVSAAPETSAEACSAFRGLYRQTMDRRRAIDYYYFSPEFFEQLERQVAHGFARLFIGRDPDGSPVCAEIVLLGAERAYDFLAGSDERARLLHANPLLRATICSWLAERGWKEFVLGGGNKPDDQLFQYKLKFAPYGRRAYHVGSKIYDAAAYTDLLRQRHRYQQAHGLGAHRARRFPEYR